MEPFSGIVNFATDVTLQATQAQTITMPFDFKPYSIDAPADPISLPDLGSIDFINHIGSSTLTIFSMFDSLSFLGTLVMLFIVVRAVLWLYQFVTDRPANIEALDVSGGMEAASEVTGEKAYSAAGKVLNFAKRNKIRF